MVLMSESEYERGKREGKKELLDKIEKEFYEFEQREYVNFKSPTYIRITREEFEKIIEKLNQEAKDGK